MSLFCPFAPPPHPSRRHPGTYPLHLAIRDLAKGGVTGLLSRTKDPVLATIPTGSPKEAGGGTQEVPREAVVSLEACLQERPSFTRTEMELGTQKEGPESSVRRNKDQLMEPHKTFPRHMERSQVAHTDSR